jgi:hypothetical protein
MAKRLERSPEGRDDVVLAVGVRPEVKDAPLGCALEPDVPQLLALLVDRGQVEASGRSLLHRWVIVACRHRASRLASRWMVARPEAAIVARAGEFGEQAGTRGSVQLTPALGAREQPLEEQRPRRR